MGYIELLDDGVIINTDNSFRHGCPTCDFGSEYINHIELKFRSGKRYRIRASQMYRYAIESVVMLFQEFNFCEMTRDDFLLQLERKAKRGMEDIEFSLQEMEE